MGCSTKTVKRYEDRGLLQRARVKKTGAHYFLDDVVTLANKIELNLAA